MSESELKTAAENTPITSFADFQNANIARLSEAIEGKTPQEAIDYLNQVQERFAFEIWERKEKSWAAEHLKNEIKAKVEKRKGEILPSYQPEKLSGVKRSKKIKTESENTKDKTVALFTKMGISAADADAAIKKMMAETFQLASGKVSTPDTSKPLPVKCPKCNAFILAGNRCMICKTEVLECEVCGSKVSSLVDTKTRNGVIKQCKTCNERTEVSE